MNAIVQDNAAVRQDLFDGIGPLFAGSARHDLCFERDLHFRTCPRGGRILGDALFLREPAHSSSLLESFFAGLCFSLRPAGWTFDSTRSSPNLRVGGATGFLMESNISVLLLDRGFLAGISRF